MKPGVPIMYEGHGVACPLCRQPMRYADDAKEGERVAVTCGTPGCMFGAGVEVTAGTVSDPKFSAALEAGRLLATGGSVHDDYLAAQWAYVGPRYVSPLTHDEAPTADGYLAARPASTPPYTRSPWPWRWDGSILLDANGRFIVSARDLRLADAPLIETAPLLEYMFNVALRLLEQASHPSAGADVLAGCRLFLASKEVTGLLAQLEERSRG